MGKDLYIAEKPSVAGEFAKVLKVSGSSKNGYMESDEHVVTWCLGHLVTMSYPEKYDEKYRRWSFSTLPFIPEEFKYEVIASVKKQYKIVSDLLKRKDIDTIYVCTDSGREGEYIYRLVAMMADVKGKKQKRVWTDSQTEEELKRAIRDAKDLECYDNLAAAAFLRAKEDYLIGINFSRALTLRYGRTISGFLKAKRTVISAGRVMTCVLGMVVRREREIRSFVKTPFYRVVGDFNLGGIRLSAEWKSAEGSKFFESPLLYRENGFKKIEDAKALSFLLGDGSFSVSGVKKSTEKKNPPLLYNLAELQNDCSRLFKISPDQTLNAVQQLYERKLVTYPRTDARVLSSAIAKEINKNISGLTGFGPVAEFARETLENGTYKGIEKTRYVNDGAVTDHYAIIPTGYGLGALGSQSETGRKIYELIVRRFLAIFYPPALIKKISIDITGTISDENGLRFKEKLTSGFKSLVEKGYMNVSGVSVKESENADAGFFAALNGIKKGDKISTEKFYIKEGETKPPKRYTTGSMILAMENAGSLIEDEELRAQIKGSGIGTSATRAEILKKLCTIKYISANKKTQVITPTLTGEMIYDAVSISIKQLLNPELTASWEKGLTYVAEGSITPGEYMQKLEKFVSDKTDRVKNTENQSLLFSCYEKTAPYYRRTQ